MHVVPPQPDSAAGIDFSRFSSLGHMVADSAARFPQRSAFHNMGRDLSYRELDRLSAAMAAYLTGSLGLQKGDRIALMMPNLLQYPIALYGALRAGLVVVNVNPLYTARELEHQLKDSGARVIVILENFVHVLEEVRARTPLEQVLVTAMGDMLPAPRRWLVNAVVRHVKQMVPAWSRSGTVPFLRALARGGRLRGRDADVAPHDMAFLQYTGGTTGVSKGAVLTHGNLLANVEQAHSVLGEPLGEEGAVFGTPLPLYHVFALTVNCLLVTRMGGTSVLITNPRDIPALVKELGKHRIGCLTGVNTLFNALVNDAGFARLDFSHWKVAVGGGTAIQQAVAEKWQAITGLPLVEGYGLTETSPLISVNPVRLGRYTGTVGVPVPGTIVTLRDDQGKDVAHGSPGELCVKGPQVMQGYWGRPEETAKVFHADGFFTTGDIAVWTAEGYLKLVDRKKDMVLVSGFNVYPNEVEDIVARHPGVQEVACIGVPDDRTGEAVKIFVVKRDAALNEADLIEHCRQFLTAYKVPRQVEFRDELPKSNVGKILRRSLRDPAPSAAS
ncbi:AMP-binding protein [Paludibacterium paludis]|uniref:Long-chain-fatty-acid--CoA ligase n=1 Tax=Paludibacterium paludis TaxID=1225769 RepID=A0A918P2K2_9NEIS|nr:AMP-binding protein [Paludibacterium paludis]GGY14689.1 long-chain-fatty-acid--CoA ligase [Paludibacterium paludis]